MYIIIGIILVSIETRNIEFVGSHFYFSIVCCAEFDFVLGTNIKPEDGNGIYRRNAHVIYIIYKVRWKFLLKLHSYQSSLNIFVESTESNVCSRIVNYTNFGIAFGNITMSLAHVSRAFFSPSFLARDDLAKGSEKSDRMGWEIGGLVVWHIYSRSTKTNTQRTAEEGFWLNESECKIWLVMQQQ